MTREELIELLIEAEAKPKKADLEHYKKYADHEVHQGKKSQRIGLGVAAAGAATHLTQHRGLRAAGKVGMVAGGLTALQGGSRKKYGSARQTLHKHLSGQKLSHHERVSLRMKNPSGSLVKMELRKKHHKNAMKAYASDKDMAGGNRK